MRRKEKSHLLSNLTFKDSKFPQHKKKHEVEKDILCGETILQILPCKLETFNKYFLDIAKYVLYIMHDISTLYITRHTLDDVFNYSVDEFRQIL